MEIRHNLSTVAPIDSASSPNCQVPRGAEGATYDLSRSEYPGPGFLPVKVFEVAYLETGTVVFFFRRRRFVGLRELRRPVPVAKRLKYPVTGFQPVKGFKVVLRLVFRNFFLVGG